jgi:hypothetical protein
MSCVKMARSSAEMSNDGGESRGGDDLVDGRDVARRDRIGERPRKVLEQTLRRAAGHRVLSVRVGVREDDVDDVVDLAGTLATWLREIAAARTRQHACVADRTHDGDRLIDDLGSAPGEIGLVVMLVVVQER